ncbi:MAG: electron transport complex subunit RsxG [Gammaproteobacteria bacterium]|nr:electron transport complex subunit RsxG [Gammaproteobacteria bacterium]
MANPARSILHVGFLLAFSALAGTGVMAITHYHTKDRIEENKRQVLIRGLTSVLPNVTYDNDLIADHITVKGPDKTGANKSLSIYRARYKGEPAAAVVTTVAPDGYSGPIKILVGIQYNGVISGVRVVEHRETPGLGDAIEAERSDWVFSFDRRSRQNTSPSQWQVKKDGGVFDQFTGATITPRAVVRAVHNSLQYFEMHREELFAVMENAGTADNQQKQHAAVSVEKQAETIKQVK